MKSKISNCLILLAVATATAVAATIFGGTQGHAPVQTAFLAFIAAILAIQVIPALMLFAGILRGLFAKPRKELEH